MLASGRLLFGPELQFLQLCEEDVAGLVGAGVVKQLVCCLWCLCVHSVVALALLKNRSLLLVDLHETVLQIKRLLPQIQRSPHGSHQTVVVVLLSIDRVDHTSINIICLVHNLTLPLNIEGLAFSVVLVLVERPVVRCVVVNGWFLLVRCGRGR